LICDGIIGHIGLLHRTNQRL